MFIFILSLYSFIISYYAFDLLEFIILSLSKKFSLDLMLTQLEDLTIIIFDLVNYSLLVLIIPFLFIQLYFFFAPAFYGKEKKIMLAFLTIFLLSGFFSLFLAYISFMLFYDLYSVQLFDFNLDTSTKILVDLKKILGFIFLFVKYNLFIFLPINLLLTFFFNFFKSTFSVERDIKKVNLLIFIYLYFLNIILVENIAQVFLFYFAQILQLEFLIILEFIFLHQGLKELI